MEIVLSNYLNKLFKFIYTLILISTLNLIIGQEPLIEIHYLGHSSFVLEFDNGLSVVTDYGEPNAWVQYGWDSPIYSIGDLIPDIMTYSHTHHEDHYDPNRIPEGVSHILKDNDSLLINGPSITPIRVCETSLNNEDNSAFLFSYKGFRFLHLGDAQAQIMNINNQSVCSHMQSIIPDSLDLLFMPVEGQSQFIPEAEVFIDLFNPKRIIPMHYWSQDYRTQFLNYLTAQNDSGKTYQIFEPNGSKLEIRESDQPQPIEVYSLMRDAYSPTEVQSEPIKNYGFKLEQNFPNPFNPRTKIKFSILTSPHTPLPSKEKGRSEVVRIIVYDIIGNEVSTLLNEPRSPGTHEVEFDASILPSGVYFYSLRAGNFFQTRKMLLIR